MTSRFHFHAMRAPTDSLEPGSQGWLDGMSMRFQTAFDQTETHGVERLIAILKKLLEYEPWKAIPEDKPCKRADLYYEGITGKPWKVLVSLVQEYDPELAILIQSHVHPGQGARSDLVELSNNITKSEEPEPADRGTSKSYTLNRLRRDHPELFERVVAREISANRAAIEAGFRKVKTPLEQVMALLPKLTEEERLEVHGLTAPKIIQSRI